jgi:hypothetical protein
MIEVKPMKAEDMLWVIEHGVKEAQLKMAPTEEMKRVAKEREESGMCVTGWIDGQPECVAGIDLLWEGVGDVWMMVTPCINDHIKEGYKCIRKGLKKLIKDHKMRRLQSYGRIDFAECHNLFKHLGFEVEGLAREYTADGIDCIMYAKVT